MPASVGGPSRPRALTSEDRPDSTYTTSGSTTVVSLRMQSSGKTKTSPRPRAFTCSRQEHEEVTGEPLMERARRGGHEQLAFVQLVATTVGRQRRVLAVGEDDSRRHVLHP